MKSARPPVPAPIPNGATPAPATGDIYAHLRAAGHSTHAGRIFSSEWPLIRAELDLAIAVTDAATIARRAHYLRSSAFLLDNTPIADEANALRLAAEAGQWDTARTHLAALAVRARALLR